MVLMFNAKLYQLVTLSIVAGCTTQPVNDHGTNNVSAAGTGVQCHVVEVAGSMIAKTVCTTKAQRDAQQTDVNEFKNAVNTQPAACTQTCGAK
jgi:hypothetical protein